MRSFELPGFVLFQNGKEGLRPGRSWGVSGETRGRVAGGIVIITRGRNGKVKTARCGKEVLADLLAECEYAREGWS